MFRLNDIDKNTAIKFEALKQSVTLWTKFLGNTENLPDGLDIGKEILKTADEFKDWIKK
jgi:hypothetical protein